jgi:hypothetical protein
MLLILALPILTLAHMRMVSPQPEFQDPPNANAPANICGVVKNDVGGPEIIPKFNQRVKAQFATLRDYADSCAQATNTKKCGKTNPNRIVAAPSDGIIRIEKSADHIGPSEIWINDNLVMANSGEGSKTPAETRINFGQFCSGTCIVRFVMAALHNGNPEIFDNCVQISMNGQTGSAEPPSTGINKQNKPTETTTEIVVVETQTVVVAPSPTEAPQTLPTTIPQSQDGACEWACSSDRKSIIRFVRGEPIPFACPGSTLCTFKDSLIYPVCDFA